MAKRPTRQFSAYGSDFLLASPHTPHRGFLFLVDLFHLLCESLREKAASRKNQLFIGFLTKSVCSACHGILPRGGRTGNYLKSTRSLEECYEGKILHGNHFQKAQVSFANK